MFIKFRRRALQIQELPVHKIRNQLTVALLGIETEQPAIAKTAVKNIAAILKECTPEKPCAQ